MTLGREEKKLMKDYVKSITKVNTRQIFEWTAGQIKEYDYDCYQLESIFSKDSALHSMLTKSPSATIWYVKRSIRLGKIFLRLKVTDSSKPPRFRQNGWAIRNQSTREDKTAFGRSMLLLSSSPKSRWKFWKT